MKRSAHPAAAYDREYISKDAFAQLFAEGTEIRKMMIAFITSMTRAGSGVKNMRKTLSWTEQVWQRYERITGKPRPEIFNPPKGDDE